MKKMVLAIGIVTLFFMTAFAGATVVQKNNNDPQPCPNASSGRKYDVDVGYLSSINGKPEGSIAEMPSEITVKSPCSVSFNVDISLSETRSSHGSYLVEYKIGVYNLRETPVVIDISYRLFFIEENQQVDRSTQISGGPIRYLKSIEYNGIYKVKITVRTVRIENGDYQEDSKWQDSKIIDICVEKRESVSTPGLEMIKPRQPAIRDQLLFSLLNKLPMFSKILE